MEIHVHYPCILHNVITFKTIIASTKKVLALTVALELPANSLILVPTLHKTKIRVKFLLTLVKKKYYIEQTMITLKRVLKIQFKWLVLQERSLRNSRYTHLSRHVSSW